jgi:hypothetical protein
MNASTLSEFVAICQTVRKYQRQVVPAVGTKNTVVPLAQREEFPRLSGNSFLPVAE